MLVVIFPVVTRFVNVMEKECFHFIPRRGKFCDNSYAFIYLYIKYFRTMRNLSSYSLCIYAILLLRNTNGVHHAQLDWIT